VFLLALLNKSLEIQFAALIMGLGLRFACG
jgi:hypothetical protein